MLPLESNGRPVTGTPLTGYRVEQEGSVGSGDSSNNSDDSPASSKDSEDDSSTSSTGSASPSTSSNGDKMVKKGKKAVRRSEAIVYLCLFILALATGGFTWFFVAQQETETFQQEVREMLAF